MSGGLLARATSRGGVARSAVANSAARLLAILGLTAATVEPRRRSDRLVWSFHAPPKHPRTPHLARSGGLR